MKISKVLKTVSCAVGLMLISEGSAYASQGTVQATNVNIRQEANTSSSVLGKVQKGDTLTVIDVTEDWFKVSYNNVEAFISADYLDLDTVDGVVKADDVKVHSMPTADSDVLYQLVVDMPVVVTGKTNEWYQVIYSGQVGYINKEFVHSELLLEDAPTVEFDIIDLLKDEIIADSYGVVNANPALNLRKEASLEAEIISVLPNGVSVHLIEEDELWVKAVTDIGQIGYLRKEYVNIVEGEKPKQVINEAGQAVIDYAVQFIGTPYVWAGNSLTTGVDCSGFVNEVMKNFGIALHRSSYDMASNGVPVEKSDLQAGDLVFFNANGSGGISHVGIAMGDGQYIHASNGASYGVVISDLNSSYSSRSYVTARRVL